MVHTDSMVYHSHSQYSILTAGAGTKLSFSCGPTETKEIADCSNSHAWVIDSGHSFAIHFCRRLAQNLITVARLQCLMSYTYSRREATNHQSEGLTWSYGQVPSDEVDVQDLGMERKGLLDRHCTFGWALNQ